LRRVTGVLGRDRVAIRVVEVALPNGAVALVRAADLDEGTGSGQVAEKAGYWREEERADIWRDREKGGWPDAFDLDGVSKTLEGIANAVRSGLVKVKASKTTVELGIDLAVKSGKLTALVVEGGAAASLKVTLEWGGEALADVPGK
jgi:hypothetical protein